MIFISDVKFLHVLPIRERVQRTIDVIDGCVNSSVGFRNAKADRSGITVTVDMLVLLRCDA